MIIGIWLVAGSAVLVQSSMNLAPDFCSSRWTIASRTEDIVGLSLLIILPIFLTLIAYIRLVSHVRSATRGPTACKPSLSFLWDYELARANMFSALLFVLFWLPLGISICVSSNGTHSRDLFIYLVWFALAKSCFNFLL